MIKKISICTENAMGRWMIWPYVVRRIHLFAPDSSRYLRSALEYPTSELNSEIHQTSAAKMLHRICRYNEWCCVLHCVVRF